jgi:hypothetical protein
MVDERSRLGAHHPEWNISIERIQRNFFGVKMNA